MHIEKCDILYDQRAIIKAKAIKRCIINKSWVETGTQGLHYCEFREFNDKASEAVVDPEVVKSNDLILEACKASLDKLVTNCKQAFF